MAPGVDKAGPAGVENDVFSVPCAEPDGGVVEGLAGALEDCRENRPGQIMAAGAALGTELVSTHSSCECPT